MPATGWARTLDSLAPSESVIPVPFGSLQSPEDRSASVDVAGLIHRALRDSPANGSKRAVMRQFNDRAVGRILAECVTATPLQVLA